MHNKNHPLISSILLTPLVYTNPQATPPRTYRAVVCLERGDAHPDGPLGVSLLLSCLGDHFPHGAHAHGRGLGQHTVVLEGRKRKG